MGCCVLIITLISQLFALKRKVRSLLGLPVADEWGDVPARGAGAIWRDRFRAALSSTAGKSVLAAMVSGELAFAAVALPGPNGLLEQHRHHLQQVVELFTPFVPLAGADEAMCRTDPQAAVTSQLPAR